MKAISISGEGTGEFALISRLTKDLASRADVVLGVGDDTAILDIGGDQLLLATTDSQVEGVHFTFQGCDAEQVGRKALAVNLSDIAAMGGEPRFALVSLVIPPHFSLDLLEQVFAGMRLEAEAFSTAIVGGNVSGTGKGEQLILDITLLGTVERNHAITRAGAASAIRSASPAPSALPPPVSMSSRIKTCLIPRRPLRPCVFASASRNLEYARAAYWHPSGRTSSPPCSMSVTA